MPFDRFLFASSNAGKLAEIRRFAEPFGISVFTPRDIEGRLGTYPVTIEDQPTYIGNARKKALEAFQWSGMPSLGDDSGLEVDALGGAPGVFSARYAGEGVPAALHVQKLLKALSGEKNRAARFRAVLVLVRGKNESLVAEGVVEGLITTSPRGTGGFGYDPIFDLEGKGKTVAELKESKSAVDTHRVRALAQLFELIKGGTGLR